MQVPSKEEFDKLIDRVRSLEEYTLSLARRLRRLEEGPE